ncbi:hypothetical protein [Phenylobacterium soli]|uniref:Cytochrome c domain-containing protein n=1 Tax=Phenylobacterium soli TaxID=2170551 RepID=A0A328AGY2_9CAUL|nr:hypothetical protein [Phenylobacterium soli]RAK54032.1 hypothetical protein DJ017_05590 [Phenylobacterium soli]
MDRPRPRAAALGLAIATAAGALGLAAEPGAIRAFRWAAQDVDPQAAFAREPTECLTLPTGRAEALKVEVGRAAFRTPLLLGGQAARAGVACETCHAGGRSNPTFLFPGVSGAPGTADVTDSLFSSHRGDGIDNPRPIPDLSGPKARLKVDQSRASRKLEPFIRGLIVEEFDGPEPPPAVLDGLAAYVRALSPAACPRAASAPVTPSLYLEDARRAVRAAEGEIGSGDAPGAVLMLAAARTRLGQIDERFAGDRLAAVRAAIRRQDDRLAAAQEAVRQGRADARAGLEAWLSDSVRLEAVLRAKAPRSLFDPRRLTQAFRRRLPG